MWGGGGQELGRRPVCCSPDCGAHAVKFVGNATENSRVETFLRQVMLVLVFLLQELSWVLSSFGEGGGGGVTEGLKTCLPIVFYVS